MQMTDDEAKAKAHKIAEAKKANDVCIEQTNERLLALGLLMSANPQALVSPKMLRDTLCDLQIATSCVGMLLDVLEALAADEDEVPVVDKQKQSYADRDVSRVTYE